MPSLVVKPSTRPRILFICQRNPWLLNNGGVIRNYWLIRALAERFDVDLVTCDDADDTIPDEFSKFCGEIHRFPRPGGLRAKVARAMGALRIGSSYYTSGCVMQSMRIGVQRLLAAHSYSAVVTELGMTDAIPSGTAVPIVYSAHNCEAALLMRRAQLEPVWSRLAIIVDAFRLRRLEAQLIERAVIVTPCSQNDVKDMASFAPSIVTKAVVIPNGVDRATYADVARVEGTPGVVLITGSFDWLPNRRGLEWFLTEVLPKLDNLMSGKPFEVRVAGRMNSDFAEKLNAIPRVKALPNVPRMDVELREASVIAVPVVASSGTRLRILEAWAAGRPVVTTPHGAFGLDHSDGIDLFACSSPQQFAEAAATLLADDALRGSLRAAGLERAAQYDWSVVCPRLLTAFEQVGILDGTRVSRMSSPDATAIHEG